MFSKTCQALGRWWPLVWQSCLAIASALKTWEYPFYYLDFETIGYGLPRYDDTSPYEQIPFQFSCHIETDDHVLVHHEYLHDDLSDPRPMLIEALDGIVRAAFDRVIIGDNHAGATRDHADASNDTARRYFVIVETFAGKGR
jgi:hypothetical protein